MQTGVPPFLSLGMNACKRWRRRVVSLLGSSQCVWAVREGALTITQQQGVSCHEAKQAPEFGE